MFSGVVILLFLLSIAAECLCFVDLYFKSSNKNCPSTIVSTCPELRRLFKVPLLRKTGRRALGGTSLSILMGLEGSIFKNKGVIDGLAEWDKS